MDVVRRTILALILSVAMCAAQYALGDYLLPPSKLSGARQNILIVRSGQYHKPWSPDSPDAKRIPWHGWWIAPEVSFGGTSTLAYGWPAPFVPRRRLPRQRRLAHALARHRAPEPRNPGWPTEVIWPGLALNIAFWMLLALGAQHLSAVVRRRARRRRGRCPRCAYDLRGLESPLCPECGQQQTTRQWVRRPA